LAVRLLLPSVATIIQWRRSAMVLDCAKLPDLYSRRLCPGVLPVATMLWLELATIAARAATLIRSIWFLVSLRWSPSDGSSLAPFFEVFSQHLHEKFSSSVTSFFFKKKSQVLLRYSPCVHDGCTRRLLCCSLSLSYSLSPCLGNLWLLQRPHCTKATCESSPSVTVFDG